MENIPKNETISLENIKDLELFDVRPKEKFIILITVLGLKPVSEIHSNIINENEQQNVAKQFDELFKKLNVFYEMGFEYEPDNSGFMKLNFEFSRDINLLNKPATEVTTDLIRYYEDTGIRYGYPRTAVFAFAEEEKLKKNASRKLKTKGDFVYYDWEFPDTMTLEQKAFLFFRPSKNHFGEEMLWLDNLIKKTKEISPRIYGEVMASYKPI